MSQLVEVAFKGNRKEFFLWDGAEPLGPPAAVLVEADRGEDLGRVHAAGELAERRCAGCAHGAVLAPPSRRVLRRATPEEERWARARPADEEEARRRSIERVRSHGLVMKVSDAEWQFDRRKLTLYFTAERRVDFRALVRDLATTFHARIELQQIGVRDEAKRLDGVGRCGRQYCSASWLPELRPVNLQVAKDQRLSLNPTQISGACGRLMCCLRFEHEFYVQSRKRFPKEGRILVTALGEEKVLGNDIFGDRVTLRGPEGEQRTVPLAQLRREMEEAGGGDRGGGAAPEPRPAAGGSDGERTDAPAALAATSVTSPAPALRADAASAATGAVAASEPAPAADQPESTDTGAAGEGAPHAEGAPQSEARRPRRRGRRGGRRGRHASRPETPPAE